MGVFYLKDEDGNPVKVVQLTDATQDVDGERVLMVGAVLFGREDANTVIPVAVDSSGNVKIVFG